MKKIWYKITVNLNTGETRHELASNRDNWAEDHRHEVYYGISSAFVYCTDMQEGMDRLKKLSVDSWNREIEFKQYMIGLMEKAQLPTP